VARTSLGLAFAAVGALLAASLAVAAVENRFRVADDAEGRGYPRSLAIVMTSPDDYVLDYVGRLGNDAEWKGPRAEATLRPTLGGDASLGWSAGLTREPATRTTIVDALVHDWQVVAEGTEPVERTVSGRPVGALTARWVLTQGSVMAGEARYEAGVVVPLCGRTAYVGISALSPSGDSAGGAMGFGEYVIRGMRPTVWNRIQVMTTIERIRVDGSMPAARVAARAAGRRVSGTATDCNGHPVAGEAVRLERLVGRRWVRAAAGRTTATGAFALPARAAGLYRAVVGSRRSAAVRVR
jgi:hypothetical protein